MTTERIPKCPECERDMVFDELSEEFECEGCQRREREAKRNARALSPLTPEESFPGHPDIASALREQYMKKAFDTGWSLIKEFIGPREKVEEGKRMVEGDKVRYGQRKWDGVVVPEVQGYIDDEGNERDASDAYHKYKKNFADIDVRYRHDQNMSGERPKPHSWGRSAGGEPYPLSARQEAGRREKRIHDAKMQIERLRKWNGVRPHE